MGNRKKKEGSEIEKRTGKGRKYNIKGKYVRKKTKQKSNISMESTAKKREKSKEKG